MANRTLGNVIVIDSAQGTILPSTVWPSTGIEAVSIFFYSTDTTGELKLTDTNTTNVVVHIRSNQQMPYTHPYYLSGVRFQNSLIPLTVTAGTAFLYFR